MDGARNPGGGFGYEAIEEAAGCGTDIVAAFGVPLNTEDEVGSGPFGGLAAFDGFDHSILWTASGDAEPVAGNTDGLMMA